MKFVFLSRYFVKYSPGEAHHISLTCLTVDFPCLEKKSIQLKGKGNEKGMGYGGVFGPDFRAGGGAELGADQR
jgi:hypothetical protein